MDDRESRPDSFAIGHSPFAARRGYAICTAPRSGSNLLCQYLASTGMLGRPLEYFNPLARRIFDHPDYPDTPQEQIEQIQTTGATPNGIYGVKLFWYQHAEVTGTLDWSQALPNLSYVCLQRRDVLGQALSWARAVQTSQYRSRYPATGVAVYDAALIRQRLDSIRHEYAQWSVFFAERKIAPVTIVYEDFVTDPQSAVDAVARHLGVRPLPKIAPARIDLEIQRDAITEEWRERFLREAGYSHFHSS